MRTFRSGSQKQQQINDAQDKANKAESDAAAAVADYNAKFALQQAQLDGEVSNWYYDYTPTLNNEPASTWFDNAERDRHTGDTFLNTEPFVSNEQTPDAGKAWRWLKVGVDYHWSEIADSDAVKALKEAAKAQSTADGKSTTYVVKPTAYSYGDTWILESAEVHSPHKKGEMLFASLTSESYNYDHWVTKVRYTDDTAANAACDRLNTWASDSVISPTEKKAVKDERIALASEKQTILADATRYETVSEEGVSNIPTLEYVAAWTQYDTELAYHSTDEPESITIRTELAEAQTAYYAARQTLLNLIADVSKKYVDDSSSLSMNTIAQNLGYRSHADMVAQAVEGKAVIQGGYINAKLIDTDTLIAKNIITRPISDSDKRHIEITSASNSMIMYDAQNNPRLVVHGANYQSIEDITGVKPIQPASFGSASFEMAWKYPEELGFKDKSAEMSLCTFSIDSDNSYTMTVPPLRFANTGTTSGQVDSFSIDISLNIVLYKDGHYFSSLHYDSVYWYGGAVNEKIIPAIMAHELTRGNYNIKIEYRGTSFIWGYPAQPINPGPGIKLASSISLATPSDKVLIAGLSQVTKMFANGFASTWSSNKYFSVINRKAEGSDLIDAKGFMRFTSENGNYGLRHTNDGILITDNGADANPNWYSIMPGLVYAGVVNDGYPGRRWPDNHGGWTAKKISVGHAEIRFKQTPFTSSSDYIVLLTNTWEKYYASVNYQSHTGFNVMTADDTSLNDSNFCFLVLSTKKWR